MRIANPDPRSFWPWIRVEKFWSGVQIRNTVFFFWMRPQRYIYFYVLTGRKIWPRVSRIIFQWYFCRFSISVSVFARRRDASLFSVVNLWRCPQRWNFYVLRGWRILLRVGRTFFYFLISCCVGWDPDLEAHVEGNLSTEVSMIVLDTLAVVEEVRASSLPALRSSLFRIVIDPCSISS